MNFGGCVFSSSQKYSRVVPQVVWRVQVVDVFAERLPGIENTADIFDPSVFDMRTLLTVVAFVGLVTFIVYTWWVRRIKKEDTFFEDIGISYSRFELPDEVDDYNVMKVCICSCPPELKGFRIGICHVCAI